MTVRIEFVAGPDREKCPDCGGDRVSHAGEVTGPDGLVARFGAWEYAHGEGPEIFLDVTFGTRGLLGFVPSETFGTRFGAADGHDAPVCTLVTGAATAPRLARRGRRLTRDEALAHPRLDEFWHVVDQVIEAIPHRHARDCTCCGGALDEHDRHVRLLLPDRIAERSEAERLLGVGLSDSDPSRAHFLEAAAYGCFVRSLLRVRLTDGYSLTYGLWVRVTPETAQRLGRVWENEDYYGLRFEGWLGNALPGLGHLDAPVTVGVVLAGDLPRVLGSPDPAAQTALSETHERVRILEAAGHPAQLS